MTPGRTPCCIEKTRILIELRQHIATVTKLYKREVDVIAAGTPTEIAAIDVEIETTNARVDALESAYEKHLAEHGC